MEDINKTDIETPEQVKARKHEQRKRELQTEYNMKCAELGQSVYRVRALNWEIEATERNITAIEGRLKELNEKAAKFAANEPEVADATT